jgi:hypothetical protein
VAATVADQVVERVTALMASGDARTQADAIRRVAAEMDRSVSATSSAFYAGRRAAADEADASTPPSAPRPPRAGRPRPRLYAEMLPLVEAGASIEQAARRFGDEDEADEIAAGFARWLLEERLGAADEAELAEARRRITALEAETRGLRRDLTRATQALSRVHAIADDALGASRDL